MPRRMWGQSSPMSHIHVPSEIPIRYLPRSERANTIFLGMFAVGLAGFVFALTTTATLDRHP